MKKKKINILQEIEPIFNQNSVPIVFATDNNYLPLASVSIQSIIENSSKLSNYDVIVLVTSVSNSDQNMLKNMAKNHENFSIRCYDISEETKKFNFKNCSYYTDAIYYRLFMPYIMKNYEKTIYLDCDLVVENDIANLFNIDIADNLIGGVKDIGMIIYKYNKSELQYLPKNYFADALPEVDIETYFNTGVLTMNLKEFRKNFELQYLIEQTNKKIFLYPDQDGLNNICCNKKVLLDMKWNTYPYNHGARSQEYTELYLPESILKEYMDARSNPYIIHYNMLEKPWLHPCWLDHNLMQCFWKYAAKSPFFDRVLFYKPSEFYKSKKRMQIPYFEKAQINHVFKNSVVKYFKTSNDVLFCTGEFFLTKLSDLPIKYETLDINPNEAILNASFLMGLDEMRHLNAIYFVDERNNKYECQIREKGKPYCFGEIAIGQEYIITAKIPIMKDVHFKLRFIFNHKPVFMKRLNFSRLFPIDRLNKRQFFFHCNKIVFFRNGNLCIVNADFKTRLKYEFFYALSLLTSREIKTKLSTFIRLLAKFVKHFSRKPIWIIGCNHMAEDNGFAFFKYLQSNKNIKSYFAVNDKNSIASQKAKKYGNIIHKYSKRFQWLVLISELSVSSIVDMRLIKPFCGDMFRDILMRRKFVFLQHGVTSQDQSREHNRFVYNPNMFCTCAQAEYDSIINGNYFYNNKQVQLTGFPRYDYLYNNASNIIAIMPTWRKYLKGDYNPYTLFYRFYDSLLHDERLQRVIKQHKYKILFKPHPTVLKNMNDSAFKHSESDDCFELSNCSYSEIFAISKLLVTDYSSAAFDFLYLRKPVIYSQFDSDEFFSGKHVYTQGYIEYEKNGFGEIEYSVEATVDRIIEYIENDCRIKPLYLKRVDSFFAYDDKSNSQRVYNAIIGLKS